MTMKTVLVVGGSGFVGRYIVGHLASSGHRVIVPTRRRDHARHLFLLPTVEVHEANVAEGKTLQRLAQGTDAVINLVGILNETGRETFAEAHVGVTQRCIAACEVAGVRRFIQMSALNADARGPSRYQRSKGDAEASIVASKLDWTIFQPSVIFGREDAFLNLFAGLLRYLPVMALAGANVRFQPVFVGDVAECFVRALDSDATIGQRYPLCGPRIYTLRELVRLVGEIAETPRPIVPLGATLGKLQALVLENLPGKLMSRDNLASMQRDSVCDCPFPALFGVAPASIEAIAPLYLAPDAAKGRYDDFRAKSGR